METPLARHGALPSTSGPAPAFGTAAASGAASEALTSEPGGTPPESSLHVRMPEEGGALEAFRLVRGPDGTLSVALQAQAGGLPDAPRVLAALRRRLEQRGWVLDRVKMADDDADELSAPRSSAGVD